MTLVRDTVRGALWTISAALGSRAVGLVGTLIITHFIAPDDYGEVSVASVLVMTANQLSTLGLGQYLVSRPDAGRSAAFHATTFHVLLGIVALAVLMVFGPRLGPSLSVGGMARYLPGLALAALFDRVAFVPERILIRDLRFGVLSVMRTAGDMAFTAVSIWLAASRWGALAIVMGNIARSGVRFVILALSVERRDWLEPCRLTLAKTREIMAFAVPVAVGSLASFASRRWDNLFVSRFFGASATGMYNLAYNLADVPATQVGEQLADVLLPSFARLDPERRPAALVRALGLLSLIVFPLAVGLGAVAPTLVSAVFDPRWQPIAPMLVLLAALSVARPVSWVISSYLQARQFPLWLMWLELGKLVTLVAAIVVFGRYSVIATCIVVGAVYAADTLAALGVVRHIDHVPLASSLGSLWPALAACVPMVALVLATRHGLMALGNQSSFVALVVEVGSGAIGYVISAWVFAPRTSRDLVARLNEALGRKARAQS